MIKTLVVDDNIVNRVSIQKIMQELGENEAVNGGREAIDLFTLHLIHSKPFDLILLDIMMPGMDGIKVLKAIRQIEKDNHVAPESRSKILMVTSHSHKDVVLRAMKMGCDGYIVKPFRRDVIIKKLKELKMTVSVSKW